MRFGMAGVVPGAGVGLRIGAMFVGVKGVYKKGVGLGVGIGLVIGVAVGVGDEPLAISRWRSPIIRSIALAVNSSTLDWLKLLWAT
jgi:hypothetical protein